MSLRLPKWMFCLWVVATVSHAGLLPDMTSGIPSDFALRRAGAEVSASYRVGITNEGLYRINYSTLTAAGLSNVVGNEIRVYCQTQEVAVYVSSVGAFGSGDYVLFYGTGYDGYYTSTNVYWLGIGGSGSRMSTRSGVRITSGYADNSILDHVVVLASNSLYRAFYEPDNVALDHWFMALLKTNGPTSFVVPAGLLYASGQATLSFILNGLTTDAGVNPDHRTEVVVNGTVVANILYDGHDSYSGTCTFAASPLGPLPAISFRQTQTGVADDRAYLKRFSLQYPRWLEAENNAWLFTGLSGTNNYYVNGFTPTNTTCWILDVSNPFSPSVFTNYAYDSPQPDKRRVCFGDITSQPRQYYACATSAVTTLTSLEKVFFRNLASTSQQADYIVICPYEFRQSAYRLLKHRFTNGLNVAVAPVTDIYNEFSYGVKDAAAIKQFLGYAFHHWSNPPPKYAILLGNGSYDPRDYLKTSGVTADVIPVHLGPTPFEWSALDGWFATVNGPDMLVDIAIGRVPVATDSQLSDVAGKIMAYEALSVSNAWHKKALLAADNVDGTYNFKGASTTNVNSHLLSNGFACTPAYLDDGSVSATRTTISNKINSGVFVVSYFGHGAVDMWADESIFNSNDVTLLNNSILPLFTVLTCRNGDFDEPGIVCMAEQLLARPNRGAIAAIAANTLSIEEAAEVFANGFYEALMKTNQYRRVGDVMNAGLLKLWTASPASTELLFYEVFGDPALVVNPTR